MKSLRLNQNTSIPILGLGTWKLRGDECTRAVLKALEVGYRHIDTADRYENHREVAAAIRKSRIKRGDIFLTTKIPPTDLSKETVLSNCDRYLEELDTSYIDLLLIHWPNHTIPIKETLSAMNELKLKGKIRAIGVSNFTIHHLEDAMRTDVEITNNQVELHPTFNQIQMKEYCDGKHIAITAYSPLGRASDLDIPLIQELSKKYEVTPSQVILNWIISKEVVAIPKSATPKRIEDNFKAITWSLEQNDIEKINHLEQNERLTNPPWSEFDY
ncbi:MAG: aldo/keto reductase [Patescibacteria group bacterium]